MLASAENNASLRVVASILIIHLVGCFQSLNTQLIDDKTSKYLFYLHGGVVQEQGINAVSKYYGRYEYQAIIDSLAGRGFQVISEVRPKGTVEKEYAQKVKFQVDSLFAYGVKANSILIVGASQGAYIALEAAMLIKNPKVNYVLLGLCSDYAITYFKPNSAKLKGRFLSIYEKSDAKGSCKPIFQDHQNFEEIALSMGISHSFLFKPYKEWIDPLAELAKENRRKD